MGVQSLHTDRLQCRRDSIPRQGSQDACRSQWDRARGSTPLHRSDRSRAGSGLWDVETSLRCNSHVRKSYTHHTPHSRRSPGQGEGRTPRGISFEHTPPLLSCMCTPDTLHLLLSQPGHQLKSPLGKGIHHTQGIHMGPEQGEGSMQEGRLSAHIELIRSDRCTESRGSPGLGWSGRYSELHRCRSNGHTGHSTVLELCMGGCTLHNNLFHSSSPVLHNSDRDYRGQCLQKIQSCRGIPFLCTCIHHRTCSSLSGLGVYS